MPVPLSSPAASACKPEVPRAHSARLSSCSWTAATYRPSAAQLQQQDDALCRSMCAKLGWSARVLVNRQL
jgi:hypothetical protein